MRIANPIYDSVFKHLMEDGEIARGLVSRLLGVTVVEMTPQPQEITQRQASLLGSDERLLRVYRVDFSAVVELADGSRHKVLIELQKAQSADVVGRFRDYLGQHYAVPAKVQPLLPIIAIYMLGFNLHAALPKVVKVQRRYLDGVTGEAITEVRDPFIERLTHDAVVVQIPKLDNRLDTELERALQVFDQRHREANPHYLAIERVERSDPLLEKMVRTLAIACADEDTQEQMKLEDELTDVFERLDAAEREASEAKKVAEEATARAEEERRAKEAALTRLAELERQLSERPNQDG